MRILFLCLISNFYSFVFWLQLSLSLFQYFLINFSLFSFLRGKFTWKMYSIFIAFGKMKKQTAKENPFHGKCRRNFWINHEFFWIHKVKIFLYSEKNLWKIYSTFVHVNFKVSHFKFFTSSFFLCKKEAKEIKLILRCFTFFAQHLWWTDSKRKLVDNHSLVIFHQDFIEKILSLVNLWHLYYKKKKCKIRKANKIINGKFTTREKVN